MSLVDRIKDANRCFSNRKYYRFVVNGHRVGLIDIQLLDDLLPSLFIINKDEQRVDCYFSDAGRIDFEHAIEQFFRGYFVRYQLTGWRNELFAVAENYQCEPLFLTERATLSFLGVTGYGVHINGFVETNDGLSMWIAKRSLTKPTSPRKLDQIAAGGLPYGISPYENVIKECYEEASIPAHLASMARPVSMISYCYDLPIGIRPDVMLNYDLKLPTDFIPTVNDDEVESFQLLPIDEVLSRLSNSQDFKFNSALAIIDFAIRHGVITPESPDYLLLCEGMRTTQRERCK